MCPHSAVSGSTFPNSEKLRAKLRNMGSSPHSAVSVNAFISNQILLIPVSLHGCELPSQACCTSHTYSDRQDLILSMC